MTALWNMFDRVTYFGECSEMSLWTTFPMMLWKLKWNDSFVYEVITTKLKKDKNNNNTFVTLFQALG